MTPKLLNILALATCIFAVEAFGLFAIEQFSALVLGIALVMSSIAGLRSAPVSNTLPVSSSVRAAELDGVRR